MHNKATSSEQEPFSDWLGDEIKAVTKLLEERGNTPAQGAYILAVALGAIINNRCSPPGDKTGIPLIAIGSNLRPQAIEEWQHAQVVN